MDPYGNIISIESNSDAHMWLEINIFGVWIPWESTCVMPIPPTWTNNYNYISHDDYITENI